MLVRSKKEGITRSRLSADKVRKYSALRAVLSGRYTLRKLQHCVENKLKIVFREFFLFVNLRIISRRLVKKFFECGRVEFFCLF